MAREATLNVSLTPTLERYVRTKVRSGQYGSASEVIREGLRTLQEREQASVAFWADAAAKVKVARQQVAEGRVADGEQAMDEILTELDAPLSPRQPKRGKKTKR